ncbi:MAG: DUF2625 domain-containing protein [Chloroflexota bacterium]|nr:DUF2625 domain-containing protein [Chloroflexota bacterium]
MHDDPAWPDVQAWLAASPRPVDVLPVGPGQGERTLQALQVTTRSVLGAVALHTGGLLLDHGWLRILGAGSERLRGSLGSWNGLDGAAPEPPLSGALIVAHDAVGGFFAINGGALGDQTGDVYYFAPDTLAWEDLDKGYSAFVQWAIAGDMDRFYTDARWPGWADELRALSPDYGILVYPFPWAQGGPIAERSRKSVPMSELWSLQHDVARQVRVADRAE